MFKYFCDRYAYIFWLKNPAAFHDDFWCFFINVWVNCFGIISQFVWHSSSTRQPLGYYICSGIDPTEDFKKPLKIYGAVEIFSFLLNLIIYIPIKIYKSTQDGMSSAVLKGFFLKTGKIFNDWDSQSLASFGTNLANSVIVLLSIVNTILANRIEAKNINQYPYTFYVYYIFFLYPCLMTLLSLLLYYNRHKPMRRFLANEVGDAILKIKERFSKNT